jgi:hypothetical protein
MGENYKSATDSTDFTDKIFRNPWNPWRFCFCYCRQPDSGIACCRISWSCIIALMTIKENAHLESFCWETQPAAFSLIQSLAEDLLASCPGAAKLAGRMREETGTRFIDWIDHIRLNRRDPRVSQLPMVGYHEGRAGADEVIFANDSGVFPPILLWDGELEIGIKVESAADFLAANQLQAEVTGDPLADLRMCRVYAGRGCALAIVERHGKLSYGPSNEERWRSIRMLVHLEKFRTRPRDFECDAEGFAVSNRLIDDAIEDLGRDRTCDLWFAAEREFWMRRNRAAQAQKARQDRLGLGWANHDHHTYRCSRKNFKLLVATWEKLGFHCRERFYAGREAGWGAQVMEQPVAGIIAFNDVDLTPEELMGDFSHDGLPEQDVLGTVGLWCALHGDSFLQAGMHHLEAMFSFDLLSKQLAESANVKMMKPFSDFPYLRQAFTEGERWDVDLRRIERLLKAGLISNEQAERFRTQGAIGSHLENLERNDGFKGFNQTGVSEIIAATDPRKHIR